MFINSRSNGLTNISYTGHIIKEYIAHERAMCRNPPIYTILQETEKNLTDPQQTNM